MLFRRKTVLGNQAETERQSEGHNPSQKFIQKILYAGVTVFCCVAIIVFGITLLTNADPVTTSIGENISTNDLFVAGILDVTGDSTFDGDVDIAGALNADGDSTVGGTLGVTGDSTFTGNVDMDQTLDVTGDATFSGDANVEGDLDVT
ncbi:MAG TPA: hypothetical protein VIJ25_16120, partial [Methylococcales bacterium]